MPWDASANAGFTSGRPWLPLASDWQTLNVSTAMNDPDSVLALHRRLLALRRAAPTIAVGSYIGTALAGPVLGYTRRLAGQSTFLVALNLSDAPAEFSPDDVEIAGTIAVATNRARDGERAARSIRLAAHEGIVVRLDR